MGNDRNPDGSRANALALAVKNYVRLSYRWSAKISILATGSDKLLGIPFDL
jgi:hypothetical protein